MEAVVDTMVFAYGLLNETEYAEASFNVIQQTNVIHAPDSIRTELTNVMWQWITHKAVAIQTGLDVLQDANALLNQVCDSHYLWYDALVLAAEEKHPAYDTLFVVLAKRLGVPLVTYDKKLLGKFPSVALHPLAYLKK